MTAEEFLRIKGCNSYVHNGETYFSDVTADDLIEFTKYHVEQALKAADNNATIDIIDREEISEGSFRPVYGVDSKSILNAYPLENIK